jgi:hypothetical protein
MFFSLQVATFERPLLAPPSTFVAVHSLRPYPTDSSVGRSPRVQAPTFALGTQYMPERGRAMAVVVGGEHWQSRRSGQRPWPPPPALLSPRRRSGRAFAHTLARSPSSTGERRTLQGRREDEKKERADKARAEAEAKAKGKAKAGNVVWKPREVVELTYSKHSQWRA